LRKKEKLGASNHFNFHVKYFVFFLLFCVGRSYTQNGSVGVGKEQSSFLSQENSIQYQKHSTQSLQNVFPGASWSTRTPAEVGLDENKLDQFISNVGGRGCIVRFGYMVKSWGGDPAVRVDWASCSKTVTSLMLLFAVYEGKIGSVDALVDPFVQSLFGQQLIQKDRTMTFRHLANMVSGYALPEDPGSAWAYNDYGICLYNKTLFDGVFAEIPDTVITDPNRLGPLQFQDGSVFQSREGYGLYTSPRDFSRFGWFMLNKGNWNGQQILPVQYFDDYIKPGVAGDLTVTAGGTPNDYLNVWFTGGGADQTPYGPGVYGFNWWFNDTVGTSGNLMWPDAPADVYQANGHWNQETLTIFPGDNMVVAVVGNLGSWEPGNDQSSTNQNLKLLKDAVILDHPLPVELTNFSAGCEENSATLQWTTASEINLYGFFIERKSIDRRDQNKAFWHEIGFIPSNGNSATEREYHYSDPGVSAGTYAYRLRIQDLDGSVEYSPEVTVIVNQILRKFALEQNYPNPFNPATTITFTLSNPEYVTLKIFDSLGQQVASPLSQIIAEGTHRYIFDGTSLPSGVYYYELVAGTHKAMRKMVLIK
jgi:CubicO group peptidase (beta-lactamase class C family)